MGALEILDGKPSLDWEYDEEADLLYISVGEPRPAVSTDIGDGVIVRFDESEKKITGITIMGIRTRTIESLQNK